MQHYNSHLELDNLSCTVSSPSFSSFPVTFPPVPDHFRVFYDYFRPFCLSPLSFWLFCHPSLPCFPLISLFRLVSFQFSILGSDRSESRSLPLIRLHFCSATIPFLLISVCYCPLIIWPPFPLQTMIHFLLFCSVYKSGKLCIYQLACNWTKPSVTWPSINPNTQSLSVSVLAS